ncbi:MAG: type II toxin-antitoxin system Phd/YefM family antitoxin [Blastocatellales bacterium]
MYEIEVKDLARQLKSLLEIIDNGLEVVLTDSNRPVAKLIRISDTSCPPESEREEKLATILDQLAELNSLSDIKDHSEWQREIRQDRSMPGRN